MTFVEERTAVTGGVDTHSEVHVAAALDPVGGLLGTREFPATAAGYAGLLDWLCAFGAVALAGLSEAFAGRRRFTGVTVTLESEPSPVPLHPGAPLLPRMRRAV